MCCRSLGEKGKHINKIPRKSQENARTVPGRSQDNPGTVPWKFCLCAFLFIGGLSGPKLYTPLNVVGSRKEPIVSEDVLQELGLSWT